MSEPSDSDEEEEDGDQKRRGKGVKVTITMIQQWTKRFKVCMEGEIVCFKTLKRQAKMHLKMSSAKVVCCK